MYLTRWLNEVKWRFRLDSGDIREAAPAFG
jgi:hypothetical protein